MCWMDVLLLINASENDAPDDAQMIPQIEHTPDAYLCNLHRLI